MKKYLYLCLKAVVGIAVFASCKSQKSRGGFPIQTWMANGV